MPTTGGTGVAITVTTLGTGAEQVGAGQFEDLNATSPSGSVITCTGTGASSLTGCTTANGAGLAVASGDPLVEVLGDATAAATIPQGPNSPLENGGVSLDLNAALSTIAAANVPGRFYVDGATIYCVNNNSPAELDNCTTTQSGGVSVNVGEPVTTDPILPGDTGQPGGAQQTTGSSPPTASWAPSRARSPIPGPRRAPPWSSTARRSSTTSSKARRRRGVAPGKHHHHDPVHGRRRAAPERDVLDLPGTTAAGAIQQVTCTGLASNTFSGCSGGTGTVAAGNDVGGPGAAIASSATLTAIGEGSTKPKTLYKNNEDLTVLRAAYTTDGFNFTDLGPISGTDPSHLTDINNPSGQTFPSTINLAPGCHRQSRTSLRRHPRHDHLEPRRQHRHVRLGGMAVRRRQRRLRPDLLHVVHRRRALEPTGGDREHRLHVLGPPATGRRAGRWP